MRKKLLATLSFLGLTTVLPASPQQAQSTGTATQSTSSQPGQLLDPAKTTLLQQSQAKFRKNQAEDKLIKQQSEAKLGKNQAEQKGRKAALAAKFHSAQLENKSQKQQSEIKDAKSQMQYKLDKGAKLPTSVLTKKPGQ